MVVNRGLVPGLPLSVFGQEFPRMNSSIPLHCLGLRADCR
jgi:hypothetical protein